MSATWKRRCCGLSSTSGFSAAAWTSVEFTILKHVRNSRPAARRLSLARFKEMLREQFLLVLLDQKRAVAALPKLLGADAAERGMALDVLHKVLAARGDLSEEGKRRLAEIERLFAARPAKSRAAEDAHA